MNEELSQNNPKKEKMDLFERIKTISSILTPFLIAVLGWIITTNYNKNQLELQRINNENQLKIAQINASVGQSALIKDLLDDITSDNKIKSIAAVEAILYAAPNPGKRIVGILARISNDSERFYAIDALNAKRKSLADNFFSDNDLERFEAIKELQSLWMNDEIMLDVLLHSAKKWLKQQNKTINDTIVDQLVKISSSFPPDVIKLHHADIKEIISYLPVESQVRNSISFQVLCKIK